MSETGSNKLIAKNTILLYLRMIVILVIGLYTSREFLHLLGVEDYGIYNIVGGFVSVLSVFSGALTSASQRFITYALGENNKDKLKKTFQTFVSLYIIAAILIFVIGEAVGLLIMEKLLDIPVARIEVAYFVFHCSLLTFCFNLIFIPYRAEIIAHERMDFFAIVSIIEALFRLVIVFLLMTASFDKLALYAVLLLISAILVGIIYMVYCHAKLEECTLGLSLDNSILKEVLSYSVWVTIGTSSAVFKDHGVNILINIFFGVTLNAARSLSMQVFNVVNMFASNIAMAITPQITKAYAAKEINRSERLTFALAKSQGLLLLMISLPVMLEAEYLLGIWLKEVPYYAVIFTQWALVLCIARAINSSIVPILLATGNVRNQQLIVGGIMLLNLPVSYLFLKIGYEPKVTMIIGAIIEFVGLYVTTLILKRNISFPLKDFWIKAVLPILAVGLLSALVPFYIVTKMEDGFWRIIIITMTSVTMVGLLSYFIALNGSEREVIKTMLLSRLKKRKPLLDNDNHE